MRRERFARGANDAKPASALRQREEDFSQVRSVVLNSAPAAPTGRRRE